MEPKALPGPASERMSKQRSRDTGPERLIRSALHRRGLRYFVHRRPLPEVRREADLVFPRLRVAIFVDGCFWHGCPEHGTKPRRNAEYWETKIARNRARDADTDARLTAAGWTPVRIWEHEAPDEAAAQIEQLIRTRARNLANPKHPDICDRGCWVPRARHAVTDVRKLHSGLCRIGSQRCAELVVSDVPSS